MKNCNRINYNGKTLIYDSDKSEGMFVPIYRDMDGQVYMPLNQRFVSVEDVIEALERQYKAQMV